MKMTMLVNPIRTALLHSLTALVFSLPVLADVRQDAVNNQDNFQINIPNSIGSELLQLDKDHEQGSKAIKDATVDFKHYQALAEQGQVQAQFMLGILYDQGIGVNQDYAQAIAWYGKAAEQGYAKAQYNLGAMYDEGLGVSQDYKQAAAWYRKAAEQGYAKAQFNLGSMYFNGEGVSQDNIQGYMWLKLAASQGLEGRVKTRLALVKNLGSSEIKKARQLARDWQATHKQATGVKK